jgi:hypothetical protein
MMVIVSLDSPSCEVPCWILLSVVYRDVTRQAKGVTPSEARWSPRKRGLAYLSWCNSGWFCHSLGCVSWHTLRSTCGGHIFGYEVEVLEAPIKGAVADHRGGDAFDEDAHFDS